MKTFTEMNEKNTGVNMGQRLSDMERALIIIDEA